MQIAYRTGEVTITINGQQVALTGLILAHGATVQLTATHIVTASPAEEIPYKALANSPEQGDLSVATVADNAIQGTFAKDRSHTYDGSTVSATDWEAPAKPTPSVWDGKQPIPPNDFLFKFGVAVGPVKAKAIQDNAKTAWIFNMVQSPDMEKVNPNDERTAPNGTKGIFRFAISFLKGDAAYGPQGAAVTLSSPTDDAIMLTDAEEATFAAIFNG